MSVSETRARLERHIDRLPVLPSVVTRLMVLDHDADDYFDQVLTLVESDPGFAARILSAANAAASSPRDPVTSIRAALVRLGSEGASAAVLAASVSRVFVPRDDWEKSLWRHALQVAEAARALIARDATCPIDPGEAYLAGLLHDVGRFVLLEESPDTLRQIDEGSWDTPEALVDTERAICGMSHPELGALACRRWNLPASLVELVARHHQPVPATANGPVDCLVRHIRFADLAMFPSAMPGTPGHEFDDDQHLAAELMPRLPPGLRGLELDDLRALIAEASARAEATATSLSLV